MRVKGPALLCELLQYFAKSPQKARPSSSKRTREANESPSDDDEIVLLDQVAGTSTSTSIKSVEEPRPECPICLVKLRRNASNAEINMHIDACMQGNTTEAPATATSKPKSQTKGASKVVKKQRRTGASAPSKTVNAFDRLMKHS